jgi:carboxyl-terminal processing protease
MNMKKSLVIALLLASGIVSGRVYAQSSPTEKMSMTLYALSRLYVDSLSTSDIVDQQIKDMMHNLDPFSEYLTPAQARANENVLLGSQGAQYVSGFSPSMTLTSFADAGIEGDFVQGHFLISFVMSGSDAYQKGIRPGDEILSVNQTAVSSLGPQIYSAFRGQPGQQIRLEVSRNKATKVYSVELKANAKSTVSAAYMLDNHTGYIALSMFSEDTDTELKSRLSALKAQGMKNLILDLRRNQGGLFDEAVKIADEFVSGEKLLVFTQGLHSPRKTFKSTPAGVFQSGKLVVLIDDQTKSAAEILSGALQDNHRGVFVGERSFGKGLIQETLPFKDGSALRITVARYFTPSGKCIQKPYSTVFKTYQTGKDSVGTSDDWGISPDVTVSENNKAQTRWAGLLMYCGAMTKAARDYTLMNRTALLAKYPTFNAFEKGFSVDVNSPVMKEMNNDAESAGVSYSQDDYAKDKLYVDTQLRALVARNLYNDNAFYYHVINDGSPVYQKGVELVQKESLYNSLLKKQK